jgi:hypothetical protein
MLALMFVLLWSGEASAQTSSGTILGRVVDKSGGTVQSADLKLLNVQTGDTLITKVTSTGDFAFTNVQPGTFTLIIQASGYKELRQTNLRLGASERLSAGTLILEVGTVSETVSVSAEITPVQTTSSERSNLLDNKQIENLLSMGRDYMSLLRVMPGVVGSEGATSLGTTSAPTINGVNSEYTSSNVDGVSANISGNNSVITPPNLDAIAQVQVLSANYQAEYGKQAGAAINVVTKSGTQDFHGVGYYYVRNEAFNANSYFNKLNGLARPRYRYNTIGGNIGGPVFWPGKFNRDKNKLFFFVSVEYLPIKAPEGIQYFTVPTALERQGDFSQSLDVSGKLIPVNNPATYNPSTGTSSQFSGNKIPTSQVNASGQALLNIFPLPNFTNRAISGGNYNYVLSTVANEPVNQEIFRVDYNPTDRWHMFFRGQLESTSYDGYKSPANYVSWLMPITYATTNPNYVLTLTYTASPTLVNELTLGKAGWTEQQHAAASDLAKLTKSPSGYNLGQLFPGNNPLNLVPAMSFGDVPDQASVFYDPRFPMNDLISLYSLTDSVTKVWGSHTAKVGVDLQTDSYLQQHHSGSGEFSGSFSFGKNVQNPNDANYGYANAVLGNFGSYTEPSARLDYKPRTTVVEWYAQDQWRVTTKLTLDYGMRFTWALPQSLLTGANFVPSLYQTSAAPTLYQYAKVGGKTVAVDPTTQTVYPAAYAGLFVPNTGNPSNGSVTTTTPGYPKSLVFGNGVLFAPRVGFSYDPFGKGKTAVRGGFGIFYNARARDGQEGDMTFNPPAISYLSQYYGSVNSFTESGALSGPSSINHAIEAHPKEVAAYNISMGVQQNVGNGIVADIAYVGTLGRHTSAYQQINEVPFGAHFLPQNQSPAGGVLPDVFFAPYKGYGGIPFQVFRYTSNYNSLQTKLTRRFANGLELSAAYTWSKAMDYTDNYIGTVATYVSPRIYNYGPAGYDTRNNLTFSYLWALPRASRMWNSSVMRWTLDNWQISGITQFSSGHPLPLSFTTVDGSDITGGGDPARVQLTGDPKVGGARTFKQWFNTGVVHRPAQGTATTVSWGNAPYAPIVGPGVNDWDTALFKNFPIKGKVLAQFRLETYNTFNHTQFSGINTAARFDASGNQVNSTFGQVSSTANPRYLQLAFRLSF